MQYTIREIEGIENFVKQYSVDYNERQMSNSIIDALFNDRLIVKQGVLKDGDEIKVELAEYTTYTRQQIKTVTIFKVVEHDSFLLKLVKS